MLQILFMILKIMGILLLVILGVILTVLLLVLFVPLRYRADVTFDGKPKGEVLVSWLLHLVTVRINYDGTVKALVKVLWFRLFDKTVWPEEEPDVPEMEEDVLGLEVPVEQTVVVKTENSSKTAAEAPKEKVEKAEKIKRPEKTVKTEKPIQMETVETTEIDHETVKKSKIESVVEKIAEFVQTFITKVSGVYQQICGKAQAGQEKIESVRTFFADQKNKNTIRLLWNQVKKIIRHILPRKIRGRVRFGFEDPATTGQILTYVSPFYGLYAKTLKLEPVFDEKVLDGELHIKGHIRVAVLLWIVIRVLLNKNFRGLLKKLMAMGKK